MQTVTSVGRVCTFSPGVHTSFRRFATASNSHTARWLLSRRPRAARFFAGGSWSSHVGYFFFPFLPFFLLFFFAIANLLGPLGRRPRRVATTVNESLTTVRQRTLDGCMDASRRRSSSRRSPNLPL